MKRDLGTRARWLMVLMVRVMMMEMRKTREMREMVAIRRETFSFLDSIR